VPLGFSPGRPRRSTVSLPVMMAIPSPLWLRRIVHGALARSPSGLALPILTGPLRGHRWFIRSANYSCWLGIYEKTKQAAFVAELHPGAVVFDIGAHVGFYSLLAAVSTKPGGKVFAFEPLKTNTTWLRRHAALNQVSVEVIEAAVADHDGQAHFRRGPNSYSGALAEEGEGVSVVSIDAQCAAGRVSLPNVVKIDVEGAEALVLKGAEETIRSARPVIFLATHEANGHRECLNLLRNLGYRVDELVGETIKANSEYVARPI
jgi:FkbM family methyltransferase